LTTEDRDTAIARFLAHGDTPAEVAERFDLTPGAIYQKMRTPEMRGEIAHHTAQIETYDRIYLHKLQRNAIVGQEVLLETMLEGSDEHRLRAATTSVGTMQQERKAVGDRGAERGIHIDGETAKLLAETAKEMLALKAGYSRPDVTQSPHLSDGAEAVTVVQVPDATDRTDGS
jgi:hypothetical protein